MFILLIVLFIIYTLCVCLDGQDLKLKWKHWLGSRLYRHAIVLDPSIRIIHLRQQVPMFVEHRRPNVIHAARLVDTYDILMYARANNITFNESSDIVLNCIKKDMLVDVANKLLVSNYVHFDTVPDLSREQIRIIATMMVCEPLNLRNNERAN